MTIIKSGKEGGVDDIYDDIVSSFQGWCLQGGLDVVEMEGKRGQGRRSNIINRSTDEIDNYEGSFGRERRTGMRNTGNGGMLDLEGISETTLQAMWAQHLNEEQKSRACNDDYSRQKRHERQRGIASLEGQGVGSFDHLNMLSSEQLQDMEKMVEEHDDRYRRKRRPYDLVPLEWLDSLCS